MAETKEAKQEVQEVLEKIRKKANVTEDEVKQLQQHFDILERATSGSHHHHDDSTIV
jgi:hypothetical protein